MRKCIKRGMNRAEKSQHERDGHGHGGKQQQEGDILTAFRHEMPLAIEYGAMMEGVGKGVGE
jgi:hypothetical protein